MERSVRQWSGLLIVALLSVAFAGCSGSDGGGTSPSPTGSGTSTGTPTPTTEPPPPPGEAYKRTGKYDPQTAISFPAMSIITNWTKLSFNYWLNKTSQCYVITSDPPAGTSTGAAPKITITSPTGKKVEFTNLPAGPGSCSADGTGNVAKDGPKDQANEMGSWTIVVTGRGNNLDLTLLVTGK